jgi:hypothetical protein
MMFSSPGLDAGGKSELELTMSQSSWSSQRISESKKRKASGRSTMDPPPKRKMTALETKLAELRNILNDLPPEWEPYDPGYFMDEMRRLQNRFNEMSANMIGEYLARGSVDVDIWCLKEQEANLVDAPITPSITSNLLGRTQQARSLMLAHVKQVRACLDGQFSFFSFFLSLH